MSNTPPSPRWQKTPYANLVRYVSSGTLFARLRVRGKLISKSLETTDIAVAKRKLDTLAKAARGAAENARDGKLTFGQALDIYRERGFRVSIAGQAKRKLRPLKQRSRDYYDESITCLLKSWPGLEDLSIRAISEHDCVKWADKFLQQDGYSASVYNHTIAILRHVLEIGRESGARYDNPAMQLGRASERPKKLQLPSAEQFIAFVEALATAGGRFSRSCADLVQFLAYGGFRKGEAACVTWADVDFKKGVITIFGDPENRTKNGEFRTVPMIEEMQTLLHRIRSERPDAPDNAPVMSIQECQKAMNRAAKLVGMARITHHDLRHLFATRCIESGVDIPTVSKWLGHKDGGALAMRVYGHLRDQHSVDMAKRVRFSPTTPAENVIPLSHAIAAG